MDIKSITESVNIVDIIQRYFPLKKEGTEYVACCPFHEEKTPSFKVSEEKQIYYCFGCGKHGDVLDFLQEYLSVDFKTACDILQGKDAGDHAPVAPAHTAPKAKPREVWTPIIPVPRDAPKPPEEIHKLFGQEWRALKFIRAWKYQTEDGGMVGRICRFEWQDENGETHKEYYPQTFCESETGNRRWKWHAFPKPRPLFNLPGILRDKSRAVLITEGEKAASAAYRLVGDRFIVSTFAGGSKAVKYADITPLKGRRVILWRDADEPGRVCMDELAARLMDTADAIVIIDPPDGVTSGWDAADALAEGWNAGKVMALIRDKKRRIKRPAQKQTITPAPIKNVSKTQQSRRVNIPEDEPVTEERDSAETEVISDMPFKPLGVANGIYYFLGYRSLQITQFSETSFGSHGKMLSLAPLDYWEKHYPAKNGVDWDMATNALIGLCCKKGVFDASQIRGRGAWYDNKKTVIHTGKNLIIDGDTYPLTTNSVSKIYTASIPMEMDADVKPLNNHDAHDFVEICEMLSWERSINALLYAGWIALSPICGALNWRPHIWITGGAGTGKSWIQSNLTLRMLGNIAVNVQGNTTEAGVRQFLGNDARPVIFDEAESDDFSSSQRIQGILQLARQASSETGGEIIKGSAGGIVSTYRIRSMFAFSSIGIGVKEYSDKTRVSILALKIDQEKTAQERNQEFQNLESRIIDRLTDDYVAAFRARAISLIPAIRANAKTFAKAGNDILGSQRMGDQIGALLAGAYSLFSAKIISLTDAKTFIKKNNFEQEKQETSNDDDATECLQTLMGTKAKIQNERGNFDSTYGELVGIVSGSEKSEFISIKNAKDALKSCGILVKNSGDEILIAPKHQAIKNAYKRTKWETCLTPTLLRIPGAENSTPRKFNLFSLRTIRIFLTKV
jgi:putative DNA primase/helicase